MEHHTAADHDDVDVGGAGEGGEHAGGDLDGDGELGVGAVVAGCVGVDHRNELWWSRP